MALKLKLKKKMRNFVLFCFDGVQSVTMVSIVKWKLLMTRASCHQHHHRAIKCFWETPELSENE